jgi:hypothetical protein
MFKKAKRQPIAWKEILVNHVSDKGLVSRVQRSPASLQYQCLIASDALALLVRTRPHLGATVSCGTAVALRSTCGFELCPFAHRTSVGSGAPHPHAP